MEYKPGVALKRNSKSQPAMPKNAPPAKRLLAWCLDLGLLAALTYASAMKFKLQLLIPELELWQQYLAYALWYYLILTIIPNAIFSQSLGKMILGIKVLNKKYKRLSFLACLIRDLFLRPLILITPWTLMTKKSTATHDKIAKTIVVEAR
jgi:uncharacterized RDD family membrane protein YckC